MNKVLIVDDHLVVREGLKLLIETNDHYTIIGEAENGKAAVRLADELKPDIILMDLYMPEMSGLEAIKLIKEQHDIPIIILTTYNEDHLMIEGIELGGERISIEGHEFRNPFSHNGCSNKRKRAIAA